MVRMPDRISTTRLRSIDEGLANIFWLLSFAVGGFLALDTTRRPWYSGEAFWAYRRFALKAASKTAVVNSTQGGLHLTQESGLAVYVSHRQISFRRMLNLIHLVRALLDCDAVPLTQHVNQFGLLFFEDLPDDVQLARCNLHTIPSAHTGRL